MSKQLRLVSNNQDFKVSDTAEIIRFSMIGDDGQPYPIVKGDKPQFRISALGEYKLIDAQVAGASQVSFNSQQINDPKPLPAGTYNFELWITHQNGTVSIFPDDNYLSFTLNKNIMGFASEKVTNLSLESVETEALKYIDDRVKELKAAGLKGDPGKDATLDIGTDGNWIVNGKDLGRKAQGPQGIQGPKGDPGDRGPQGIQGPKGDKGDKGNDAVINVVTQAQYDALADKSGVYFIEG